MFASRLVLGIVVLGVVAALVATIVDQGTAGLTLIGALLVAVIAAEAAHVRQARQIDADTEKQMRTLEAERARHLTTLAHDRELANLDDLRSILDTSAVTLHRGEQAILGLQIAYRQYGTQLHDRAPEALGELQTVGRELDTLTARLAVRRGREANAVKSLAKATLRLSEIHNELAWLVDDTAEVTRRKADTIESLRGHYDAVSQGFRSAAVGLMAATSAVGDDGR